MQELVGKVITEIRINKSRTVLTFLTNENHIIQYHAEGDCCSKSWIEHVEGVQDFIGKEIESFEEVTACHKIEGMLTSRGKGEMVDVYFYRLKVKGGWNPVLTIDLRNDSNGYYGGTLEYVGERKEYFDHEWKQYDVLKDF